MADLIPAILTTDSREQLPYLFAPCTSRHVAFKHRTAALPAGDYAAHLAGETEPEHVCVIERKSHADLLGTLTAGRERFERELERLRSYGFRALVVEASLPDIAKGDGFSRANPRAIIASLVAFAQRYGLHVYFASDRRHAEAWVFRLAERWVRDRAAARRRETREVQV